MTAIDQPHFVAAGRLVRPLSVFAAAAILVIVGLFVLFLRIKPASVTDVCPPHVAGIVIASICLAALGSVACLCVALGRRRDRAAGGGLERDDIAVAQPSHSSSLFNRVIQTSGDSASGHHALAARAAAGWPQTFVTLLFCAAAGSALWMFWPQARDPASANGFGAASLLLLFATPWLIAERGMSGIPVEHLPEIRDLRALAFLPVFFLVAEAALMVAAGLGFGSLNGAQLGLAALLFLICTELLLRAIGARFLPPPDSSGARATITSFFAEALSGRSLSPSGMAGVVRSQVGMDFSRSWALRFMRSAAAPVALLMVALCWFLTGVTRIDLNERGSYERFGIAASILPPGLHVVLPWPFGVVRHQELGVIHTVLITNGGQRTVTEEAASAEGPAPASANRLWDSEQPSDVSYLIASGNQDRPSFETVSASLRVLYRIGLQDADAKRALYREADPDGLVHSLAGRVLASYFASETLPRVLGENQGVIATELKAQLQASLDGLDSGIEIVAVIIETIHPPAGAAPAYRNVQAAEIAATTQIATEQGRAQATNNVAKMNAHNATNEATAVAAQIESAAKVDLTNIAADDRPYRVAAQPFLLERYFSDLQAALANVPLEIVDHRLTSENLPTIDLRPPGYDNLPASAGKTP